MLLIKLADREFPVSVNHGEYHGSYVSLPHSAYVLYAREELDLIDIGWMENPAKFAIAAADHEMLKAIRINHIVQIDNWLLSTNLHGDWNGEGIVQLRKQLTARFPDHYLGIRSIDNWSNPTDPITPVRWLDIDSQSSNLGNRRYGAKTGIVGIMSRMTAGHCANQA